MASGTADDQREIRYREKQIEFSRRWYQAHVRRAEADPDYFRMQQSEAQRGSRADGPGSSAYRFLEFTTGQQLPTSPAERDVRFAELVAELDDDADRFERVASWWDEKKPTFLDPVLVDRCEFGINTREQKGRDLLKSNADAMVAIADYLGPALVEDMSRASGHRLKTWKLPVYWVGNWGRPDLWVDWRVAGEGLAEIGLRLWLSHKGAALGVMPGWGIRPGWKVEAEEVISSTPVDDFRVIDRGDADDMEFYGRPGSFIYGCPYRPDKLADLDLRAEAVEVAAAARPVLDALISRAQTGDPPPPPPSDPLADAVAEFRKDRGYPTGGDRAQIAQQPKLREMLLPDHLAITDRSDLRKIWTTSAYGHPGPQSMLNRSLRDADEAEYEGILRTIDYLCWGREDDADRIDKVLNDPEYKVKGLGESVILKLLAVCHPDRYICVYPYSGKQGKLGMLRSLKLREPSTEVTRGRKHVESNNWLRERLEPFFPGDSWGMMCFLYWYVEWDGGVTAGGRGEAGPRPDPIGTAAEDLLIKRAFLDDIVGLLEDKGQVILYGPPGTGKTFLAQRLAEALAPKPEDRTLVQFHPSTSYEDFFEGYRPEEGPDGQILYRLTPGPLARMAERAAERPQRRQVMVIDEINRANLPKVLGELLFLFEYRDRSISTLYRPEGEFELPKSLWFIGTMNTADRSIALVDAALRRRFHFVPFFPDRGPTAGLLERWLDKERQPAWVGKLVAMVNGELTEALGADLQLGPSHFMKQGYLPAPDPDDTRLRRIWEYNIEPLIEDQLFGDPGRITRFRFESVMDRYRSSSGPRDPAVEAETAGDQPDPGTQAT